jgi:aldehyde:ferredoxin oxidoreductase
MGTKDRYRKVMDMDMMGYSGKLLVVDLSTKTVWRKELDPEMLRKNLGGRGLGAQLLYDLCPPRVSPFDPSIPFMVLTGPVSGTPVLGSSKHVVVTKSPATGGWLDSYSSGYMAAHLKYAGWDGLVVIGRSEKPCYLQIEDDRVEFRDASPIWRKDAFEAEQWLKDNVATEGGKMAIGPAGENRVQYACINSEFYRQTGRGGAGAVMGAKNMKAITVNGSGGIRLADPQGLLTKLLEAMKMIGESPRAQNIIRYGTFMVVNITNEGGIIPTRNFQTSVFPQGEGRIDKDGLFAVKMADHGCSSCPMPCGNIVKVDQGPYAGSRLEGPEYETLCLLGSNLGIDDVAFIIKANILCDRLGLDTMSMGNVLGFAMECYERGLLTREQTGGLDLHFGNQEAALQLIEKTAALEGFGAFLAQGVAKMAEAIGRGARRFAMHVKGLELPGYDPRGAFGAALTYAVNPRGGCHRRAWPPAKEILGGVPPYTVDGKPAMIKGMFDDRDILHSLVVCDYHAGMVPIPIEYYQKCLPLVTGNEFSRGELLWIAERTETLIRLFNCREGFSRREDAIPDRILEEPLPEGPAKGQCIGRERFERMLDEYYELRGWDNNGNPKPETLKRYEIAA